MDGLPLLLYLTLQLQPGLTSLPAPVNLSVTSVNFHHVLRWDPGPGTPPGTRYTVIRSVYGKNRAHLLNSTTASFKLKLQNTKTYCLAVQASYNQTRSPESHSYIFTPFRDTKIGPPNFSLAGCGNCIQINMSLPKADRSSRINDIQMFYSAYFRVLWQTGEKAVEFRETQNKSFTLNNLQEGTKYCVQVHTKILVNTNTEPSVWKCTFTSIVEPRRDPVVLGSVAALILVMCVFTSCLYYTGFLCKLAATPPKALIIALSQGYTLTPEGTIPDLVSISSEVEQQRQHTDTGNNPTMPHSVSGDGDEDEEEEEEDGINVYMDRDDKLSSGQSLCWGSGLTVRLPAEVELPDAEFGGGVTYGGLGEDEAKAEGATVFFQTGLHGHATIEEEEKKEEEQMKEKEVFDSSGNVNLFSVTLAALGEGEEEEEEQSTRDCLTDLLGLQLPTDPKKTLKNTDSQTETDNQATTELMQPTHEDFTETGYKARHADTSGCIALINL